MVDKMDTIIIRTTTGQILGKKTISIYEDVYCSFERIPYALPPLGDLRFRSPVPIEKWSEVWNCTRGGEKPIQLNIATKMVEGSEDCLYLNVYSKKLISPKLLPVMVFLFGGGFEKGDPTRDLHSPDYFMMQDVVIVTISYRVGPLGFLCLWDHSLNVPGNAGLKDQLLALKWIHANIYYFNGDQSNITLFGESAGAASTHYLMLSPKAEGLFHKAILMSGNALCPWALSPLEDLPLRLAKSLGLVEDESDKSVLEFLQAMPVEKLVGPYLLSVEENMNDCIFQFGPVVEPYINDDCMIQSHPSLLLQAAWSNSIPIMMGGTSFEGLLMYNRIQLLPHLLTKLQTNPEHMLPLELKRKLTRSKQRELGDRLRHAHFGNNLIDMKQLLNYCTFASYKIFWHPITRLIQARMLYSDTPIYLYRFDFDSPDFNHQRIKYCGNDVRGVAHVDDHSYLWYGTFSWKLMKDSKEFKTIKRMVNMWTAFAINSDPNCTGTVENWKPLIRSTDLMRRGSNPLSSSQTPLKCLNISDELIVINLPEWKTLKVWHSLYDEPTDK